MKAIILTYAPVQESEQKILKNADIFKLAINQHGSEFKPDARICSDYNLTYLLKNFPEKVISTRERLRYPSKRVEYSDIKFKGATILCAVEWLIQKGYNDILIVGDNTVNTKAFQDNVNKYITPMMQFSRIYGYTHGNFMLPTKSITEFIKE